MTAESTGCAGTLPALLTGANKLGVALTEQQALQLRRYCELICDANTRLNLTGIRSAGGVMRTLLLDSLTIAPVLPAWLHADGDHVGRVVDVGSGAGVPGLPLKIAFPAWRLALVESIGKKARFLETVVQELGLQDVVVLPARAEELGRDRAWRDAADLCLARAVAPLPSLVELCSPFVREGGLLAFPKSGDVAGELRAAQDAMKALRVALIDVAPVDVELGLGQDRSIVLCNKQGSTPDGYPRRVGLARSRPVGTPSGKRQTEASRSNP